jgi:hypothetical protein
MAATPSGSSQPADEQKPAGISLAKIITGTILLDLLTIAGTFVFGGFTGLSAGGVVALILGVTFSYALGVGLMVVVFYSSRFYDESAHKAALDHFKDRQEGP